MPTCFITGGTGYIGSHVARHFLNKGWRVCLVVRKSSNFSNIKDILSHVSTVTYETIDDLIEQFNLYHPIVVFHIAAAVITSNVKEHIHELVKSNIQFGIEILEAMKDSDCRLFINTGTFWQNYKSDIYNPVDLYAATKEAFEKILQLYVDACNIRVVTLRLFDVFGEDDKRPKLWNILRDIAGTDKCIAVSPGEQLLDIVHIDDVCIAYETAYNILMSHPDVRNKIYSVQNDVRYSLRQYIDMLQCAIGKNINISFGAKSYKEREVMEPMAHYERLPGWLPTRKAKDMFTFFNTRGG
jgi:nucleoside-diphosphate-sugar epimerase